MKALFIGAGATYDCGMPLVWELTAEIRRWLTAEKLIALNKNWKSQGGGWDQDVILCVVSLLENENLHYENIIGAIEVECARERDQLKRQSYHAALGFLLQAVYGLLMERQVKNTSYALAALEDFSSIKEMVNNNKPLWIFSLNHDCIIEMLALKLEIPLKSGFNEEVNILMKTANGSIYSFPFERLSRKSIEENQYDFFRHGEFGINLIKLHGALDIFGQNDELNYLKVKPATSSPDSLSSQIQLLDEINQDTAARYGIVCTNENIYEDENGEIQFLRKSLLSGAHKFTNKLSQIAPSEFLSLFKGNLNYANELICIGYSFGDKHIDDQIADWLSFSASRKLNIVNPGINSCPERMKHLSSQVTCSPLGAADFFIQLSNKKPTVFQAMLRKARTLARDKIKRDLTENA
ncbi:hypothetical protein Q2E61_14270 [Microbulbifer thermotolerans]|uniref:hypothetical protein n=1 Tax=Microbulbifer thermotolerans TaxID=252514 RepID=UPI00224AF533|nr:hypothetical protein [Microbulbifer thermotolerans]MCX2842863.1 hypothetical protein [Microbulbifer thermotolerans]WKT60059.1 hypothetical protein Q2E61_14270 [Microbulbifer thermotolerans]